MEYCLDCGHRHPLDEGLPKGRCGFVQIDGDHVLLCNCTAYRIKFREPPTDIGTAVYDDEWIGWGW